MNIITINVTPLQELHKNFNVFRCEEKFCDIIIKVENRSFPCHRIILASAMEYFQNMFSGNFSEAKKQEIELKSVKSEEFELLLTYIYTGSIKIKIDQIYHLLRISNYLEVSRLKHFCTQYVVEKIDSISLSTNIDIFLFACDTNQNELIDGMIQYMAENFTNILEIPSLENISEDVLSKILILLNKKLKEENPGKIFNFLIRWVRFKPDKRRERLPALLNVLYSRKVSDDWYLQVMANSTVPSDFFNENFDGSNDKGIELPINGKIDENVIVNNEKNRKLPFTLFIEDTYIKNVDRVINLYQFTDNEIQFVDTYYSPDTQHLYCKSIFVDELLYTILYTDGGKIPPADSNNYYYNGPEYKYQLFLRYRSKERIKLEARSICSAIDYLSVTAIHTNIYLYDNTNFITNNCEIDEWTEVPQAGLIETEFSNLLGYNNSLYLIGGRKNTDSNYEYGTQSIGTEGKLFQHYDTREKKWSQLPEMTYVHNKAASCIYKDNLYVSGGDKLAYYKGYIECFDFRAGKWDQFETSMPEPKMNHILVPYNDQLWFFGGQKYNSGDLVEDLTWYYYDLEKRTWSKRFLIPRLYSFSSTKILDVVVGI